MSPAMSNPHHAVIVTIPQQGQRQDALSDQLRDLIVAAHRLGMYDAADLLMSTHRQALLRAGPLWCRGCGAEPALGQSHREGCPER